VNPDRRSRLAALLRTAAPVAALLVAAALLLRFPPEQYAFYPQCPIHHFLGFLCPGCGATRALAALLHGHIAEAMQLNGLVTLSLPMVTLWLVACRPLRWPQPPPAAIYAALTAAAVFTVVRNL